jgi:hypothetical protein
MTARMIPILGPHFSVDWNRQDQVPACIRSKRCAEQRPGWRVASLNETYRELVIGQTECVCKDSRQAVNALRSRRNPRPSLLP